MKKIKILLLIGFIIGFNLINTKVLANTDWWQISNDEKGFIVRVQSDELEYSIHLSDSENCDNINSEISFDDNNYEWSKIKPNVYDNSNSTGLNVYNIPYKMDYLGNRCQVIIVKGMTGIENTGKYSHQYYANVVNGTGVTPTPSPTPTMTQVPNETPIPTKKPTIIAKNDINKKDKKTEKSDNSLYGIIIIGLLIIFVIIWRSFFKRKKTSINY